MTATPWHVCVLIPARNEEGLLPRCLRSIIAACSLLPKRVTFDIVVAVDRSTDMTHAIAELMLSGCGAVTATQAGVVGSARSLAATIALQRYSGPFRSCWLANTDADCSVPPHWLVEQLRLAQQDVEAIAGTVDVDSFHEHGPEVEANFRKGYYIRPDGSHCHVHGANLGVRADVYLRAGGWRALESAEDHDLWNRLGKIRSRRIAIDRLRVVTSGRRIGRAPHGFAEHLAERSEALAC